METVKKCCLTPTYDRNGQEMLPDPYIPGVLRDPAAGWPAEAHEDELAGKWLHSDFHGVALPYVHSMYAKMIELGDLNE